MRRVVLTGLFLCFGLPVAAPGQMDSQTNSPINSQPEQINLVLAPVTHRSQMLRSTSPAVLLMQLRNDNRQNKIVADTNKLMALVSNLKQQADKKDVNLQSAEAIKVTAEIEKLARDVKERMKE